MSLFTETWRKRLSSFDLLAKMHTKEGTGTFNRNCAGSSKILVPGSTKVSAMDVIQKAFFEPLYWFQDLTHLISESTFLPYPHCSTKIYFSICVQICPLFFCQHTIHQVIWPNSGTLSRWDWLHVHICPNLESSSKSSSKLSEFHSVLTTSFRKKVTTFVPTHPILSDAQVLQRTHCCPLVQTHRAMGSTGARQGFRARRRMGLSTCEEISTLTPTQSPFQATLVLLACALTVMAPVVQGAVIITSMQPDRGSLAGGTRVHIQVHICSVCCSYCVCCPMFFAPQNSSRRALR